MSKDSVDGSFSRGALLLALIQASALWLLHQSIVSRTWPATDSGGLLSAYLVTIFLPLTLLVLWPHRRDKVLWWATSALAGFLAWAGYQSLAGLAVPAHEINLDEDRIVGFLLPWGVAWLIALPMLRARLEVGHWRTPYAALFRSSWRSCLMLAESALFTGVFWLLLLLWAALFNTLGNDFFSTVFSDPRFIYPATTLAFAAATQIIGGSDRFIDGVLDQLLGLMKWLLPLAGIIVIAFSVALIPKLPALISSGERVINSSILLALVAVTLLLFNAAYREGNDDPGYGRWLTQGLRVVPPLLVVIALVALYSLAVRLIDLGLTPARYWGITTAIFAVLYSAGYAYASVRSGPWLAAVKEVNFLVSVALLAALLVSLTPIADPLRLSVASQLKRAIDARDAESQTSALRFLRFDASERGRGALDAIVRGEVSARESTRSAALRQEARQVAALTSKRELSKADPAATPARYMSWRSRLQVIPSDTALSPSLEEGLRAEFSISASILDPDNNTVAPRLVFVDLDGDDTPEALLWAGVPRGEPKRLRDYRIFRNVDGRWSQWSSNSQPN